METCDEEGAVVRSLVPHHSDPGSSSGLDDNDICWLSLLFLSLASRGFSPGTSVTHLSTHSSKTNTSKFKFDLERTDTFKRVLKNC